MSLSAWESTWRGVRGEAAPVRVSGDTGAQMRTGTCVTQRVPRASNACGSWGRSGTRTSGTSVRATAAWGREPAAESAAYGDTEAKRSGWEAGAGTTAPAQVSTRHVQVCRLPVTAPACVGGMYTSPRRRSHTRPCHHVLCALPSGTSAPWSPDAARGQDATAVPSFPSPCQPPPGVHSPGPPLKLRVSEGHCAKEEQP